MRRIERRACIVHELNEASPPTQRLQVGQALQAVTAVAGDDEELRAAAAGTTGAYAKHCSMEELRATLIAGPLAPSNGRLAERIGCAQIAASIAHHAAARLEELGMLPQFVGECGVEIEVGHEHVAMLALCGGCRHSTLYLPPLNPMGTQTRLPRQREMRMRA